MAAPQFSPSRPRNVSRSRNFFSLEEANRALPLVWRIVRDVVSAHERAIGLQGKLEELQGNKGREEIRRQLEQTLRELQDYVEELTDIGVELKDYGNGLIDFPGRHQGREICLCWKLGEEKVAWWHERQTGYAGRRPASMLDEP